MTLQSLSWLGFRGFSTAALCFCVVAAACDPDGGSRGTTGGGGGGMAQVFGRSSGAKETWTIECAAFDGATRRETADRLAAALKRSARINADRVRVQHDETHSRIFYGEYVLRYREAKADGPDKSRGDLVIELSEEIKRDHRYIRELALGDQFPFFTSRPIPMPVPFKGNPAWDLSSASGVYTLHVGVTFPTRDMHDYKQAAHLWVEDLRKRGYEAYYYFDPDRATASICVGTFGEDAFVLDAAGRKGYSAKVKALQAREEFRYNLENGHIVYNRAINQETNRSERIPNLSFLARIPKREDIKPR